MKIHLGNFSCLTKNLSRLEEKLIMWSARESLVETEFSSIVCTKSPINFQMYVILLHSDWETISRKHRNFDVFGHFSSEMFLISKALIITFSVTTTTAIANDTLFTMWARFWSFTLLMSSIKPKMIQTHACRTCVKQRNFQCKVTIIYFRHFDVYLTTNGRNHKTHKKRMKAMIVSIC